MRLESKKRYLQLAFNYDLAQALAILPSIPRHERILIEAGTPFIKREGLTGIYSLASNWGGKVVADLKISDGAAMEVSFARSAGAMAATALGSAPVETLNIFLERCRGSQLVSMIDMLGVDDPLSCVRRLKARPDVVILHRGRDEEGTRGKMIQYRHVTRLKSKYDLMISAAGGIGLKEARSAIFNGAGIVVANIVNPEDPWTGIRSSDDVARISSQFLETIE